MKELIINKIEGIALYDKIMTIIIVQLTRKAVKQNTAIGRVNFLIILW